MTGTRQFEIGAAYIATPTLPGAHQRVFACAGRTAAGRVSLVDVRELHCVRIKVIMGRETAMVRASDGLEYFTSAVVVADVGRAVSAVRGVE